MQDAQSSQDDDPGASEQAATREPGHDADTATATAQGPFVVTKEHRRFAEFANAVRPIATSACVTGRPGSARLCLPGNTPDGTPSSLTCGHSSSLTLHPCRSRPWRAARSSIHPRSITATCSHSSSWPITDSSARTRPNGSAASAAGPAPGAAGRRAQAEVQGRLAGPDGGAGAVRGPGDTAGYHPVVREFSETEGSSR